MLHQIKLPTYDQCLELIVQFQQKFVDFICHPNTPLQPQKEDFKQAFSDPIGEWLYNKWFPKGNGTYYDELCKVLAFVHANPTLRKDVINAFKHDINFFQHLGDGKFHFFFNTHLNKQTRLIFVPLMVAFYDNLLYAGFLPAIADFDRKKLLKIFWETNEALRVCPACDAPRPDITDQYYHCDIDHFFPKSLYPFLSVHAANLIPICTDCNRWVKRYKDPLDHTLPDPLIHTFHPFGLPAFKEVKVVVYRGKGGEPHVRLEEKAGDISKRIELLNRVFDLETRWSARLRDRIGHVCLDIASAAINPRMKGWTAEDIVRGVLENELALYNEKIGKNAYYLLSSSYAFFALNDKDELETLIEQIA